MPEKSKSIGIRHSIATVTSILSVITSIVYCTWFFANIEKRVALVEANQAETQLNLKQVRDDFDRSNEQQANQDQNFQREMHIDLAQLSSRIEQIYQILLENKKSES